MKNIFRYTAIILVTITVLAVLWQIREAVVIFLFSLATASAFRPLIDYLAGKKIPRNIALLISYGLVIVVAAGLSLLIVGPMVREIEQVSNQLVSDYGHIVDTWPTSNLLFLRSVAAWLPPPEKIFAGMTDGGSAKMIEALLGITTNAVTIGTNLGIILVLSLYWSADSINFERLFLSLIPTERRLQARQIWQGIEKGVGAYIRSELTQSILAGILLWLGYRLMGLDYALLLAFLGALFWLIPWFGAVLAIIPLFIVGSGGGIGLSVLAAIFSLAVFFVEEFFIEPRIFRRSTYSPIVLVLLALALGDMFGLLGFILAPLVSATVQIVLKYIVPSATEVVSARLSGEGETEGIEALQIRLARTRDEMGSLENPAALEVANLAGRLDKLIEDTRQYLN